MKITLICGLAFHLVAQLVTADEERQRRLGAYGDDDHSTDSSDGDVASLIKTPPTAAVTATTTTTVPLPVFSSLERYARIVDVAYCVGMTGTGIDPPFSCASRCADFPELRLISTWNTGVLMHDSCGYIAVDDSAREIIIAFRGTYSIANTVADLSTIPQKYVPYEPGDGNDDDDDTRTKCSNCTVHMGFLASWESTRGIILPLVDDARNQSMQSTQSGSSPSSDPITPYSVHLVGHSLGGAVAALAALEMKASLGWEDVKITTFGEPRIGNADLAAFVERVFDLRTNSTTASNSSYRRVTHKNDPVPLLPLAEWGYRSHAGELYIAKGSLSPAPEDVRPCQGRKDPACIEGSGSDGSAPIPGGFFPPSLKLWELFYAHRDYFWRLGLCVPGGDPADWGRDRYNYTDDDL